MSLTESRPKGSLRKISTFGRRCVQPLDQQRGGELPRRIPVYSIGGRSVYGSRSMRRRGVVTVSPSVEVGYFRDTNAEDSDVQDSVYVVFWVKAGWARWR